MMQSSRRLSYLFYFSVLYVLMILSTETDLISGPSVITEAQLAGQSFAGYTQTHGGLKHTKQLVMTTQNIHRDILIKTQHHEAAQQQQEDSGVSPWRQS